MYSKLLCICFVFLLASCGGSQSGPNIVPIASTGFHSGEGFEPDVVVFTVPSAVRILRDTEGNNPTFERQRIVVTIDYNDLSALQVELDGITYALVQSSDDSSRYIFDAGGEFLSLYFDVNAPGVVAASIFFTSPDGSGLNSAYTTFGFDTDPMTLADLAGSASYEGRVVAALRTDDFDDAFGEGTFVLDVDFDRMKVAGEGMISPDVPGLGEIDFPDLNLSFTETDIVGNGFDGEIEISPSNGGTPNNPLISGYEGRFYAGQAEAVAGQFFGGIDLDNQTTPVLVEGYFVGDTDR